jgi:nucleoside-diphosphate-sugar epimerase
MVEQYREQYGLPITILRAPWIMEKDDFRYALSFGPDQFGGPNWSELIDAELRARYAAENRVPLMFDAEGRSLLRNFVHVSDLVEAMHAVIDEERAIGELFNIAMTDPVDYGEVAAILQETHGMAPAVIETGMFSNILANDKARLLLRWRPRIGLNELIDLAFTYERAEDDPRTVWYPG